MEDSLIGVDKSDLKLRKSLSSHILILYLGETSQVSLPVAFISEVRILSGLIGGAVEELAASFRN